MGGVSFDRQKKSDRQLWRWVEESSDCCSFTSLIFVFPTLFHNIKNREMEQKGDGELCECDDDIQKYAG